MADLLLELLSEEIPARMQARAADDLIRLVSEGLAAAGLSVETVGAHVTPRRLALFAHGLPLRTADVREEKKGPRVGSPAKAIEGFLRGAGLTSLDQCEQRDTGKGIFWFAVTEKPGVATRDVLPKVVADAMVALPWPKSMRWADHGFRWVRPLESIIAMLDDEPLRGGFNLGSGEEVPGYAIGPGPGIIPFGNQTRGHRFLAPASFSVAGYADYAEKLKAAFVLLDREARKRKIAEDAAALAAAEGLTVAPDDGLLDEVAGLVEWPVALIGSIDERFMEVPQEVLTSSMRTHQKYFATLQPDGRLAPRFIVVANTETADQGAAIVAGNQRVLRARLSDAKFFWDQDLKSPLRDHLAALKAITFHAKLGTVFDKVTRLEALAGALSAVVPGCEEVLVRHAAILAKTDLVTGMVGEFPELQGIMGRYYALAGGEPPGVADALANHYRPLGPSDDCPSAPISVALALADKIDTLVGFFAIDEKPTGSKDPFALRRAALGVIRLILENRLRFGLTTAFTASHQLYGVTVGRSVTDVVAELMAFCADRLKVVLRDRGVRQDLIDAVFALGSEDDLVRLLARVDALQTFLASQDGADLLTAYRRAANILRIEEKKDGRSYAGAIDEALLGLDEERQLKSALDRLGAESDRLLPQEAFGAIMAELARLRGPVDDFFSKVTVNVNSAAVRVNRLRLLSQIRAGMNGVADFSRVEG